LARALRLGVPLSKDSAGHTHGATIRARSARGTRAHELGTRVADLLRTLLQGKLQTQLIIILTDEFVFKRHAVNIPPSQPRSGTWHSSWIRASTSTRHCFAGIASTPSLPSVSLIPRNRGTSIMILNARSKLNQRYWQDVHRAHVGVSTHSSVCVYDARN
jgi:hypothetical protein